MLTLIALLLAGSQAMATDSNDKRLIRGYDGGMMLHAGYLCGIGGKELYLPIGPRAYIGFIFCH